MDSTPENTEDLIRTLVRSIDKRAEYSLAPAADDATRIMVSISLRKRTSTVGLKLDDLAAAGQNLMRKNQVRTTLKRAIDRMMFETTPIASTAMLRPDSQADGFFRPPSSGRRRR